MSIKIKSGFIYFLCEQDVLTNETFDYVKIGKTDYDRPVSDRIDDHQTGNPRKIVDHESFQVVSIDTIETHLHHTFAKYRILGEWFQMDKTTLREAIFEGKRVDQEINARIKALTAATEANDLESSKPEREATMEELELLEKTIKSAEDLKRLQTKLACLKTGLVAEMGTAKGIEGVLTYTEKARQPNFDEKSFKEEHPEKHARFQVEKTSLSRSFSLARNPRPTSELCSDWVTRSKEYKAKVEKESPFSAPTFKRNDMLEDLHEQYLKVIGEISRASIEKDMLEAQIKAACGTARGIEEVCSWNRIQKKTMAFSASILAEEDPELHQKYLVPRKPTHSLSVSLMRSYPFH
ncbi:MAG: GIY-YIG nuclease family protein [Verrucomicrobiota bacterium]|nr:GIY-YIG nuclease family protein [Verrucomicrobiota bacterium]